MGGTYIYVKHGAPLLPDENGLRGGGTSVTRDTASPSGTPSRTGREGSWCRDSTARSFMWEPSGEGLRHYRNFDTGNDDRLTQRRMKEESGVFACVRWGPAHILGLLRAVLARLLHSSGS